MKRFRAGMWLIVGAVVVLGLSVVPSHAAVNLLVNGSFESGSLLPGWTTNSAGDSYPVVVIQTDGNPRPYPSGAFNEGVPADLIGIGSPDAGGAYGVYFVDDSASQNLTQSVLLVGGTTYEVGFDAYIPKNGFANQYDASLNGTLLSLTLDIPSIKAGPSGSWVHYFGFVSVATGDTNVFAFNFEGDGVPAADIVVDRVYITQVPEPGTLLLLGSGLLGLALAGSRKKFRK